MGFVVGAVLLSSCETGHSPLAVSVSPGGQLRILYTIRITNEDGSVAWQIRSLRAGAGLPEYVVGLVPDGFEEVVAASTTSGGTVRIVITEADNSQLDEEVALDRLRANQVYVPRDGFMSDPDFLRLDTCPAGGLFR